MNIKTIHFLTQLKNASSLNKEIVKVDCNKFIINILKLLYEEGFILGFKINKKANFYNETSEAIVYLRYMHNKPILKNLKIISSPSLQRVVRLKELCRIIAKKKFFLFSTNLGLLTLTECKKNHVGGVLLFSC